MSTSSASYWDERAKTFGHTGWSDVAIYGYDQELRLQAIAAIVAKLRPGVKRAIDYGCGVGDFTRLLAGFAEHVDAFDISAQALARARVRTQARNVRYENDVQAVFATPADLILSITVLQHVLDDAQLTATLARFHQTLSPGGHLVLLESFAERDTTHDYIRLRTERDFLDLLTQGSRFVLRENHAWANPGVNPTAGYRAFRRHPITRLLHLATRARAPGARAALERWARKRARTDSGLTREPSNTRLLVLQKPAS